MTVQEWISELTNLAGEQLLELELQTREHFQLAKKTRWWYHRQLRASLGCVRVIRRSDRHRLTVEEAKRELAAWGAAAQRSRR